MEAATYKAQLFSELAKMSKGLASDKRLEILELLTQAPKSVDNIAQITGMSVANTSRHLQILKESHLVVTNRNGNHIIYQLGSPEIRDLIRDLVQVGEQELTSMRIIQQAADQNVQTISMEEAAEKMQDSLLLDVRPTDEYQAGHIGGAFNIPLGELSQQVDRLPKDRRIIVYCRGRLCANSNIAAQYLNQHGFDAYSLNCSFLDWQEMTTQN